MVLLKPNNHYYTLSTATIPHTSCKQGDHVAQAGPIIMTLPSDHTHWPSTENMTLALLNFSNLSWGESTFCSLVEVCHIAGPEYMLANINIIDSNNCKVNTPKSKYYSTYYN